MRILAIETATDRCGVAVVVDGETLVDLLLTRPRSHAENLVPMIGEVLALARLDASGLDGIAVSMGPGSYTGLRIGVSAAKGLAFASDVPIVGVPSLEALALAVAEHADPADQILVAFAARREEVYAGLFRIEDPAQRTEPGRVETILEAAAVPIGELADWMGNVSSRLWIAGDAAEMVGSALSGLHPMRSPVLPTGSAVGRLGAFLLARNGPADLAAFEPYYLKEFVAKKPKGTIFDRLPF